MLMGDESSPSEPGSSLGPGAVKETSSDTPTRQKTGLLPKKMSGAATGVDEDGVANEDESPGDQTISKRGSEATTHANAEGSTAKSEASPKRAGARRSLLLVSRMRRLLERRKEEFAAWPHAMQTRLRSAFKAGDTKGKAALDVRGLRLAFLDLGLEGRTPQEKEAITAIAREAAVRGSINFFDFVFQLVPEVEHKLEELRSPKLYTEFVKIDVNGTGRIKDQQCFVALKEHTRNVQLVQEDEETFQTFWKTFAKDLPELYQSRCQGTEQWLDFKGFQALATEVDSRHQEFQHRLEKRVAASTCLPPQLEALHVGELTSLKRIFDSHDVLDNATIPPGSIAISLLQCGVVAPVGPLWDRMQQAMGKYSGVSFKFTDYLTLIDGMREETRTLLKASLQGYFKHYTWSSGAPTMPVLEVPALMTEIPVCQDCSHNIEELVALVKTYEKDDHELDTDALVSLISKVGEKARTTQRENEEKVAKMLKFSTQQVLQLRESFSALSRTGCLGVSELRLWFKQINPDLDPTTQDIEALIEDVSPIGAPMSPRTAFHSKPQKEDEDEGKPLTEDAESCGEDGASNSQSEDMAERSDEFDATMRKSGTPL
jgi:hypothetical protein